MDPTIVPEFNSWLEELVSSNGSDLHVKVGSPPMVRLTHGLVRLERDPLSPIETQAIEASLALVGDPAHKAMAIWGKALADMGVTEDDLVAGAGMEYARALETFRGTPPERHGTQ